jgi:hypothetical protein
LGRRECRSRALDPARFDGLGIRFDVFVDPPAYASGMQEDASIEWEHWDGRLFHVSSVLNRQSIDTHGLDWTKMGSAPGIAGSRTPEVEGCFVAQDEYEVEFFRGFDTNDLVDVWLVEGIHWTQLIESPESFWYYPDTIPRAMISLHRCNLRTRDGMED